MSKIKEYNPSSDFVKVLESLMTGNSSEFAQKVSIIHHAKDIKIGVVASSQAEFEKFVNNQCFPPLDTHTYIFIPSVLSTIGLNLDLLLLANESMVDTFHQCMAVVRHCF